MAKKGEVSGSSGNASGDQGRRDKLEGDRDNYFQGGVSGLGVKVGGIGTPKAAADLSRKGKR